MFLSSFRQAASRDFVFFRYRVLLHNADWRGGLGGEKRANGVMKAMVEPAAAAHGLTVIRADEMSEPGTITAQIVEHVVSAKAVVADLTGENANVFYELAVRDAAHLPAVMIAEVGTQLPFDKAQDRTIFFETSDLASVWEAKDQLASFLGAAPEGQTGNPIANAMVWKEYAASGKPVEEAVAQLAEQVSQVATDVHRLSRRQAILDSVRRNRTGRTQGVVPADPGMMDQYTYHQGFVRDDPQGPEEFKFVRSLGQDEPPVEEPPEA